MSEINDDAHYIVSMKKAVKVGRVMYLPKARIVLKGSKLKELLEFVENYEPK